MCNAIRKGGEGLSKLFVDHIPQVGEEEFCRMLEINCGNLTELSLRGLSLISPIMPILLGHLTSLSLYRLDVKLVPFLSNLKKLNLLDVFGYEDLQSLVSIASLEELTMDNNFGQINYNFLKTESSVVLDYTSSNGQVLRRNCNCPNLRKIKLHSSFLHFLLLIGHSFGQLPKVIIQHPDIVAKKWR
jgi:hypothetical protein